MTVPPFFRLLVSPTVPDANCNSVSSAYKPPAFKRSSWFPCSMIAPSFITKIRSARRIVESRCAMTIEVLPSHQALQGLEDQFFRRGVQTGAGLVEQEYGRISDNRPRDRDTLALPAGKRHAAFADDRVIFVRQSCRRTHPRWPTCAAFRDLRAAGARLAVGDVFPDRPVEQDALSNYRILNE